MISFKNYSILFISFINKNFSVISFTSILFVGVFYFVNLLFENQKKSAVLLANSTKMLTILLEKQNILILKQQDQINNLQKVILDEFSTSVLNNLLYCSFGIAFTLVLGAVFLHYSNKNTSNSDNTPPSGSSHSNNMDPDIEEKLNLIIKSAKKEFGHISHHIKTNFNAFADESAKNYIDSHKLIDSMTKGDKIERAISKIKISTDSNKISKSISEDVMTKLNYETGKFLTDFEGKLMWKLTHFFDLLENRNRNLLAANNKQIEDFVNSKMKELKSSFTVINTSNLKDPSMNSLEIVENLDRTSKSGGPFDLFVDSFLF